jgi:PAS domain S-box-containing protein
MNPLPRPLQKVLVVDDDPQLHNLIRSVLEDASCTCDIYPSGQQALEAIEAEVQRQGPTGWSPWDVLLLDVSLQDMEGFTLLEEIRHRTGFSTVPALFMSGARLGDQDMERGLALGALDYLAKPFRYEILTAKVRNFAELGRFRRAAHQTALALEESEAWHRELLESSSQGIIVMDNDFRIIRCNPAAARLFRSKPDDLKAMSGARLLAATDPDISGGEAEILRHMGSIQRRSWTLRRADNTTFHAEVRADYLPLMGRPCYVAFIEDVTERVATERKVAELAEFRANLVENANVWIDTTDPHWTVTTWNRAAEQLSGYAASEVTGRSAVWDHLYPDPTEREQIRLRLQAALSGEPVRDFETKIVRKDGRRRIIAWTTNRLLGPDGRPIGLISVGQDVTDRHRMEEDLRRYAERLEEVVAERTQTIHRLERDRAEAEKFAAQGQVAAGIAHEINNPLATIQNCLAIVHDPAVPQTERLRYCEIISKEVERIARIVSQMYELYQPGSQQAMPVQINDVIGGVLQTLEQKLRQENIAVVDRRSSKLRKITAPPGHLTQVIFNIIRNAMDAMDGGGQLEVLTSQDDSRVVVEVADSGTGIAPEHLPHIFEPFFTTRRGRGRDSGLGLGLAVSRSFVETLHGEIAVVSTSPRGTRMRVALPLK